MPSLLTVQRGTRFGSYEIVSPLGAGGMGEVYRARDHKLHRDVAIKLLPAHLAGDPVAFRRFEREARAVAALSHQNIVAIHDFGVQGGTPYAVMELLDGTTLRERLGAPVSVRKAIDYAGQIALGLAAAHDHDIVHRDLKPENVFVTSDGRVKLLDFGLAKDRVHHLDDRSTGLRVGDDTAPGTVMGTVGYMSPEQVRGGTIDHRTDIFAFGAILYEMLGGQRAFARESAVETMNAILKEEPADLGAQAPGTPAALLSVVRRCLEKTPEERFQSARDLAFAFEALGSGSGKESESAGSPAAQLRNPRSSTRERLAWTLVAALLAVTATLAIALVWSRVAAPPTTRTIRIATGAPEGVYYPIGRGLGELLGKLRGTQASVRSTDGAFDNVGLIDHGETELALAQNDVVFHSVKTDRVLGFRSNRIAALGVLYEEPMQILVSRAAGIRRVGDLRGKPVALGLPHSGSRFSSDILLEYFGLTERDIVPRLVDITEATKGLLDGTLTAAITWRAIPSPALEGAFRTGQLDLLSLDPESLRGLRVANPFLVPFTIPAHVYPNLDHDTTSLAVKAMLIGRTDLPATLVNDVLTTMFGRIPDLIAYHPRAAELNVEHAFRLEDGMTIDLHPAALKFYQSRVRGAPRD